MCGKTFDEAASIGLSESRHKNNDNNNNDNNKLFEVTNASSIVGLIWNTANKYLNE